MRSRLEEARLCWRRGWSFLPLHAKSKVADLPKEHDNLYRHPSVEEMRSWDWNTHNLGVVAGAISGITVLDVDGEEGYQTLVDYDSSTFLTPQVETGKGIHYYFKYDGRIDTSVKRLPGLDIRSDGSYVVGPSSIHESGSKYQWVTEMSPEDIPLASPPSWLLEEVETKRQDLSEIGEGKRNWSITSLSGYLFWKGLPYEVTHTTVSMVNREHCTPPMKQAEVDRIVSNTYRYGNYKQSYLDNP